MSVLPPPTRWAKLFQVDRHLHEPNLMTVNVEVTRSSENSEETRCRRRCKTLKDDFFFKIQYLIIFVLLKIEFLMNPNPFGGF